MGWESVGRQSRFCAAMAGEPTSLLSCNRAPSCSCILALPHFMHAVEVFAGVAANHPSESTTYIPYCNFPATRRALRAVLKVLGSALPGQRHLGSRNSISPECGSVRSTNRLIHRSFRPKGVPSRVQRKGKRVRQRNVIFPQQPSTQYWRTVINQVLRAHHDCCIHPQILIPSLRRQ